MQFNSLIFKIHNYVLYIIQYLQNMGVTLEILGSFPITFDQLIIRRSRPFPAPTPKKKKKKKNLNSKPLHKNPKGGKIKKSPGEIK